MNYSIHSFLPFCVLLILRYLQLPLQSAVPLIINQRLVYWIAFALAARRCCLCLSFDRHRRLFNLWAVPFVKIENTQSLVFIDVIVVVVVVAKLEQYLGPNVHIKTVQTLRGNCDISKWILPLSSEALILNGFLKPPPPSLPQPMQFFVICRQKRTQLLSLEHFSYTLRLHSWLWTISAQTITWNAHW